MHSMVLWPFLTLAARRNRVCPDHCGLRPSFARVLADHSSAAGGDIGRLFAIGDFVSGKVAGKA